MNKAINLKPFYLSSINASSLDNKVITFKVMSHHETQYLFDFDNSINVSIYDSNKKKICSINSGETLDLTPETVYFLEIETTEANQDFYLAVTPKHPNIESYPINIENDGSEYNLNSKSKKDPFKSAVIKMKKRKGGTYIYCNVPERIPEEAIDTILMQNNDLSGQCFMTFEHSNQSEHEYIYLGYRIVNESDNDIYVTIKNVGYQVDGSWLGEKSWMDYYGIKYEIDTTRFEQKHKRWFKAYLNFDLKYEPKPIKPITYKIPKGKYLYVIGGTSKDAYNNININNTADVKFFKGNCANGNVWFSITNGKARGELCVYYDIEKLNQNNIVQNFRKYGPKDDFGGRIGDINHQGLIECNPVWAINDKTPNGNLKVKYYSYYADTLDDSYEPMEDILDSYPHKVELDCWWTHLSSQLHHEYVGSDMVEHRTKYQGQDIVLSVNRANPAGKIWDYGNWMIEYQENCVIANLGERDRTLKFYILNVGSLFYLIKDENGKLLKAGVTLIHCTGKKEIYQCVVKAHSKVIVSMQYVLAANNCGSVQNIVELFE